MPYGVGRRTDLLFMTISQKVLDGMLGFAAGAMIFVAVKEVIPEAQRAGNTNLATVGAIAGFAVMMTLDVALG